uniref:hypothetical protein n=1 Tax=Metapseudomonas boanensis TaxID=2822138 RepID=UPI0020409507|nr:hypothetical protein [Pseudomonas boanensis]
MHPIDLAPFWPGYEVVACRQSTHDTLLISLEPQTERLPICGRCAKPNLWIHEQQHIRQVRDRDLQDQRVLLQLPVRRVRTRIRADRLSGAGFPPSPESSLQHLLGGLVGRSDTSKARETL